MIIKVFFSNHGETPKYKIQPKEINRKHVIDSKKLFLEKNITNTIQIRTDNHKSFSSNYTKILYLL